MLRFRQKFGNKPLVFGMLHCPPIPGSSPLAETPALYPVHSSGKPYSKLLKTTRKKLIAEANILLKHNFDGVIIENMGDVPYAKKPSLETTVAMTMLMSSMVSDIKKIGNRTGKTPFVGLQILSGGWKEALTIAYYTGADFVRNEGYSFAHIGDEGFHEANARKVQEHRAFLEKSLVRRFDVKNPRVFCFNDVKKKHSSHSITSDLSTSDIIKADEF